jgi:hypothetical protein
MDLAVTAEEMSDPGTARVDLAADAVKRGRICPGKVLVSGSSPLF